MRIFLLITIRFLKTDYALLDYVSSLWKLNHKSFALHSTFKWNFREATTATINSITFGLCLRPIFLRILHSRRRSHRSSKEEPLGTGGASFYTAFQGGMSQVFQGRTFRDGWRELLWDEGLSLSQPTVTKHWKISASTHTHRNYVLHD